MYKFRFLATDTSVAIAIALIISMVAWTLNFGFVGRVQAAYISQFSDTLSDSGPGATATNTINFTATTSTLQTQTIQVTFDPTTSLFGNIGAVTTSTITFSGASLVDTCSAGSNRVQLSTSTTALTFTVCAGNTVATGTKTITISNTITNPTSTGSYIIRLGGSTLSGDTRVAIVSHVTVTAAVDTTFTFTVAGLATSTALGNTATTTKASTATALNFGTLSPNVPQIMGQQLTVTTNAQNGFAVTVHENQDLTSAVGATIHLFKDGNATSTPSPWAAPANTLDSPNTYGHIGVTSDDADLASGEFGTSTPLYAGAFQSTTTLTLFSHTGPADGATQNKGLADVAYKIEISPLQAAGNDYTNQLIYVATPTF